MGKRWLLALALGAAFSASGQVPPYVTGGIGKEERAALLAHRNDFSLQLLFAVRRSGNYLADVEVRIADGRGVELLRAKSDGPFFFVQLAPDTYTVSATYAGKTQSRRVKIGEKGATAIQLYWDDPAALEGKGIEPERAKR